MIRLAGWLTPLLAIAGIGVASYLTWSHYNVDALVCGIGDCVEVQASSYSKVLGIPVAILGLLMYLSILGLFIARMLRPGWADTMTGTIFGVSLAGVLYSAYLTCVEVWAIEAICQWCVVSALLTLAIVSTEAVRLWRQDTGHVD